MLEYHMLSRLLIITFFSVSLQSCAPVIIVGTGLATGAYSSRNANGLGGKISDIELSVQITKALHNAKVDLRKFQIAVKNSDVLIAGETTAQEKAAVIQTLKRTNGVHSVYSEIIVSKPIGPAAFDTAIHSKLSTKLLLTPGIKSVNYEFFVRRKVVYIIGISESQKEFDKVLSVIKEISDIEKVVSYVIVAGGK